MVDLNSKAREPSRQFSNHWRLTLEGRFEMEGRRSKCLITLFAGKRFGGFGWHQHSRLEYLVHTIPIDTRFYVLI